MRDEQNNFKRLMEQDEALTPPPPIQIAHRVIGTMNTYRFMGDVTDLFLPKIFSTVLGMSGGPTNLPDDDLPPDQHPNRLNPHNRG
jgi:hypothetical protein